MSKIEKPRIRAETKEEIHELYKTIDQLVDGHNEHEDRIAALEGKPEAEPAGYWECPDHGRFGIANVHYDERGQYHDYPQGIGGPWMKCRKVKWITADQPEKTTHRYIGKGGKEVFPIRPLCPICGGIDGSMDENMNMISCAWHGELPLIEPDQPSQQEAELTREEHVLKGVYWCYEDCGLVGECERLCNRPEMPKEAITAWNRRADTELLQLRAEVKDWEEKRRTNCGDFSCIRPAREKEYIKAKDENAELKADIKRHRGYDEMRDRLEAWAYEHRFLQEGDSGYWRRSKLEHILQPVDTENTEEGA